MIEVTFTESAGGGMKYARRCGFPDSEVACLPLGLSMGPINTDLLGDERRSFLQGMFCIPDPDFADVAAKMLETAAKSMEQLLRAAEEGEPVRLWYSSVPDEMCGFYHALSLLPIGSDIRAIRLPDCTEEGNTIICHSGWGGVLPEKLVDFLQYEEKISENAHRMYRSRWNRLVAENAPLRAYVNGQVISAGEELYDFYILRELEARDQVFHEAHLIGDILGKYQLGISDWLIHRRICRLEQLGMLKAVEPAPESGPGYHRYLRKTGK